MAKRTVIQNQFTRGELSPRMRGRVDLQQYYQGAQTLRGLLPMQHGGATRRPGTRYVAEVKSSSSAVRLIPFVFSTDDAYVLELGANYMRFYRDQGQIVAEDTDAAITNGTFAAGITGWTDSSSGGAAAISHDAGNERLQLDGDGVGVAVAEQAVSIGASYRSVDHVLKFRIVGATEAGTVTLRIGSSSGGTQIVNDVSLKNGYHLYTFNPGGNATVYIQFRNAANAAHDIDNVSLIDDGAIELETPWTSAQRRDIQFVQDADTMWLVHPSHKPLKLTRSAHTTWSLTSYTPTSDVFTSANNYPACVALFEQRLVFGYTNNDPQKLWFTPSGNLDSTATGTGASDGFTKEIYARQANPIRWLSGGVDLVVGTTGGVWVVDRPASSAVTVTNFTIRRRVTSGCAYIVPAEIDNRVLYVERKGRASNAGHHIREVRFDEAENEYVAVDMSLLSEHLTVGTSIVEMAWQEQGGDGAYEGEDVPGIDRILWCVLASGNLIALTYSARENVVAWSSHPTAGTAGLWESAAVIPGDDGDEVWLVCKRTIDGATKRYVELMDPSYFVDCGLEGTYSPAQTDVNGVEHLEGETVTVLADGAPVADATVTSGGFTLAVAAEAVQVGLGFVPRVELMPLEMPFGDGTSVGAPLSVARAILRLYNTVGITVSASSGADGAEILFRQAADEVNAPIPPFTGDKDIPPPASWTDATLAIEQPYPLPMTLLAVVMDMEGHR